MLYQGERKLLLLMVMVCSLWLLGVLSGQVDSIM